MPIILEKDEYLDALNIEYVQGFKHACEAMQDYLNAGKRTSKDLKKAVEDMLKEAEHARKLFCKTKKVINKATFLK